MSMFSAMLFHNVKRTYKLWIAFFLILLMYQTVIIGMYDPDNAEAFEQMMEMLPPQVADAMRFQLVDSTLTGFISGYYYGFIIRLFPMIFTITLAYSLIAKHVESGTLANYLSTPLSRRRFFAVQTFTLFGMLTDLFIAVSLSGWAFSALLFPGTLDLGPYFLMNLGAFSLFIAIGGIAFMFSSFFNEGRLALSFAIGVPLLMFVLDMLRGVSENLDVLKYFTLFSLFDHVAFYQGDTLVPLWVGLSLFVGVLTTIVGYVVFTRKDLTL